MKEPEIREYEKFDQFLKELRKLIYEFKPPLPVVQRALLNINWAKEEKKEKK